MRLTTANRRSSTGTKANPPPGSSHVEGYALYVALQTAHALVYRLRSALHGHGAKVAANPSFRRLRHDPCLDCDLLAAILGAEHLLRPLLVEVESALHPYAGKRCLGLTHAVIPLLQHLIDERPVEAEADDSAA
jgi:hypothetical protein